MSDMDGFLVKQIANAFEKDHRFDAQTNRALRGNVGAQQEFVAQLRASRIALENEVERLKRTNKELEAKFADSLSESQDNEDRQEDMRFSLISWAVSQKAYLELAIRYGAQLGIPAAKTRADGWDLRLAAIDSQFNPEHNTNSIDLSQYEEELQRLRNQIKSDEGFQEEFETLVAAGKLYRIDTASYSGWRFAIAQWQRMADQENAEAQYNLAWCYENGKMHVREANDRAKWKYRQAFENGEPRSAEGLYRLIGPGYGDDEPDYKPGEYARERNRCLAFGLERGDAWAILATEKEEQRRQAKLREYANFDAVRDLHVGAYAHAVALASLQEMTYNWAKRLAQLTQCRMWIAYKDVVKTGGIFSFAKCGEVWFYVHNTTDSALEISVESSGWHEIEPGKQQGFKLDSNVKVSRNPKRHTNTGNLAPIRVSFWKSPGDVRVYVPDELVRTS